MTKSIMSVIHLLSLSCKYAVSLCRSCTALYLKTKAKSSGHFSLFSASVKAANQLLQINHLVLSLFAVGKDLLVLPLYLLKRWASPFSQLLSQSTGVLPSSIYRKAFLGDGNKRSHRALRVSPGQKPSRLMRIYFCVYDFFETYLGAQVSHLQILLYMLFVPLVLYQAIELIWMWFLAPLFSLFYALVNSLVT